MSVLDYNTLSVVEFQVAQFKSCFPYVPTLLSFKEIPPAYSAIRMLYLEPDVFMVDCQGFAHPYGLGFASHLGLILDKPTVGVAKSMLYGKAESVGQPGRVSPLKDNKGEVIGAEVITNQETKPVYISVGHKVSLDPALMLVMHCARKYRLPEPIRRAHMIANSKKRSINPFFECLSVKLSNVDLELFTNYIECRVRIHK